MCAMHLKRSATCWRLRMLNRPLNSLKKARHVSRTSGLSDSFGISEDMKIRPREHEGMTLGIPVWQLQIVISSVTRTLLKTDNFPINNKERYSEWGNNVARYI